MSEPRPPAHHSRSVKLNQRVLFQGAWRMTIKLWPLYLIFYLANVFVSMRDEHAFDLVQDLLVTLWPALVLALACFGLLFAAAQLGTRIKLRHVQSNPGPGKPPREPRLANPPPISTQQGPDHKA